MNETEKLILINIEDEMKSSYIDYSMSVIVSRALPDVRDGLKPVHRRVLYGMYELGVLSNRPYKKSARIVGEVLGKYHPHGDSSVYDAMVRMAQNWSLRYPLIDGQGNFGSIDGDPPAAMRYTEARLNKIAEELLADIEKETVDYQLNFDDSLKEPTVMPTRIPNLLVNGSSGIAVGMATNMAPHNLSECIDAINVYIGNPEITIEELMEYIIAPDFPTGGIIYGYKGVKEAFETGRGRIILRAKVHFEEIKGRDYIIVDQTPYQVNPELLVGKIADLIKEEKIEGISYVNDESDRKGMRIIVRLKLDAIPNVVLNNLYKYTALQSSFSVNNICLVNGRPKLLSLKDMISRFVDFRHEIVVRRTKYDLRKAEERAHILEGLLVAINNLDKIIKIIRGSKTVEDARSELIKIFELSEIQARAILELRLQKLTGLEQERLKAEHETLQQKIKDLKEILDNEYLRMNIIKEDLLEMKEKYAEKRRTEIDYVGGDLSIEDMISNEKVVVTVSHLGYVKRTALHEYRAQIRGGIGHRGAVTREDDFVEHIYIATNHQYMLFFTEKGRCFWLRVFEIPEGSKVSKGRAIQNLINIEKDDCVKAFIKTDNLRDEDYVRNHFVIMVTKKGIVKKTSLERYSRPRVNGINAINVREGDMLLQARLTTGNSQVMIAVKSGKAIRFEESKTRPMGRTAMGVKGITLNDSKDEVIGMICVNDQKTDVLVVSENGYGKRSKVEDYRITNRGGKGVRTINITKKTGPLISIKNATDTDDLMIINKSGVAIRMEVSQMRVMGRNTQGVKLINIKKGDSIASVAKVSAENHEEEIIEEKNTEGKE